MNPQSSFLGCIHVVRFCRKYHLLLYISHYSNHSKVALKVTFFRSFIYLFIELQITKITGLIFTNVSQSKKEEAKSTKNLKIQTYNAMWSYWKVDSRMNPWSGFIADKPFESGRTHEVAVVANIFNFGIWYVHVLSNPCYIGTCPGNIKRRTSAVWNSLFYSFTNILLHVWI